MKSYSMIIFHPLSTSESLKISLSNHYHQLTSLPPLLYRNPTNKLNSDSENPFKSKFPDKLAALIKRIDANRYVGVYID